MLLVLKGSGVFGKWGKDAPSLGLQLPQRRVWLCSLQAQLPVPTVVVVLLLDIHPKQQSVK